MKNKGFTLVEILAVIVILALLLTVAVPSIIGISNKIKTDMYCSKVNDIKSAGKIYGEDYIDELNNGDITRTVCDLINNAVYKKEGDKPCHCENNSVTDACVTNPINGDSMDTFSVTISKKNKRINVSVAPDVENTCK